MELNNARWAIPTSPPPSCVTLKKKYLSQGTSVFSAVEVVERVRKLPMSLYPVKFIEIIYLIEHAAQCLALSI